MRLWNQNLLVFFHCSMKTRTSPTDPETLMDNHHRILFNSFRDTQNISMRPSPSTPRVIKIPRHAHHLSLRTQVSFHFQSLFLIIITFQNHRSFIEDKQSCNPIHVTIRSLTNSIHSSTKSVNPKDTLSSVSFLKSQFIYIFTLSKQVPTIVDIRDRRLETAPALNSSEIILNNSKKSNAIQNTVKASKRRNLNPQCQSSVQVRRPISIGFIQQTSNFNCVKQPHSGEETSDGLQQISSQPNSFLIGIDSSYKNRREFDRKTSPIVKNCLLGKTNGTLRQVSLEFYHLCETYFSLNESHLILHSSYFKLLQKIGLWSNGMYFDTSDDRKSKKRRKKR